MGARVLVIGAGAIGGITAALMEGHVAHVSVLDANREHVARLRDPGLLLERGKETRSIRLNAHPCVDDLEGEFDFGLISLKSPAIESALTPLAERGLVETYVSLGNGLVQDQISAIVGVDSLIIGTVEWGATNLGPGHLRQTTENPFVVGEPDGPSRPRTHALATALEPVAEVRVTDNIQGQLWSKLLVNSCLSGLGVVGGCTYAEVAANPLGREALFALWAEGHALGISQGLRLEPVLDIEARELADPNPDVRARAVGAVVACAGETKASMLQDIERGLRTEVDVINGSVVARARTLGRDAPYNQRVVELVHEFERGALVPSQALFAEVLQAGSGTDAAPSRASVEER